jgi:hypothetical protein
MEWLLKWLDDLDDMLAVARLQVGPVVVTLVLLLAFVAIVGTIFVLGPAELLASP